MLQKWINSIPNCWKLYTHDGSMGLVRIFTYIYHKNWPNVGKSHTRILWVYKTIQKTCNLWPAGFLQQAVDYLQYPSGKILSKLCVCFRHSKRKTHRLKPCCWRKRSCTSWDVYPVKSGIFTMKQRHSLKSVMWLDQGQHLCSHPVSGQGLF